MGDDTRFSQLLDMVPVDDDKIVGQAVSWFIKRQEPGNVKFKQFENGYQITVTTDEENAEEAGDFWAEHIHPELHGEE